MEWLGALLNGPFEEAMYKYLNEWVNSQVQIIQKTESKISTYILQCKVLDLGKGFDDSAVSSDKKEARKDALHMGY